MSDGPITIVLRAAAAAAADATARLREVLSGLGFLFQAEPDGSAPVVLPFAAVDASLLDVLRDCSVGNGGPLLAVQIGAAPLAPHEPWQLLAAGAADVIRGMDMPATACSIAARLQRWQAVEQRLALPAVRRHLVGDSPAWRGLLRQVVELASFGQRDLLVIGESGTGKELLARLVHTLDSRPDKGDLVVLDCGTLQPELSGSEFFGHERGAFTGAAAPREGAFALADRGTLFLDEVGELPLALQPQLLRVVQEHSFKRLGASQWQSSRFRLVCATHRELESEVARGAFRADLHFRIAACCLRMPPLRDRRSDIPVLARHALAETCPQASGFDPAVLDHLCRRDYPGNVRELRQLVARMAARHVGSGPITVGHMPLADRPDPGQLVAADWRGADFDRVIAQALEQGAGLREIANQAGESAIRLAVSACDGNLQRAASRLGVTDRALQMRRAGRQGDNPAQRRPVTPSLASRMPSR